MDRGAWQGMVHGVAESDTTEWLTLSTLRLEIPYIVFWSFGEKLYKFLFYVSCGKKTSEFTEFYWIYIWEWGFPKGNQPWIFIGRTDTEAEAPVLWPLAVKSQLIGKIPWRWVKGQRSAWQRIRWLDSVTDSMEMNLDKLQEILKDREAWFMGSQRVRHDLATGHQ